MRNRVFTYITKQEQLLVLDHVDHSYLEPQIPGGTIKNGELPEVAAIREAKEETGLTQIEVVRFLGSFERDLSEIGRNETIKAWFFHLCTSQSTEPRWRHFEMDSSEVSGPIEFELYWVPINNLPTLGGIDDAMLEELKASVISNAA
ncbi:MAG: NUDIX domain-containing protein [Porticoccus sp.]